MGRGAGRLSPAGRAAARPGRRWRARRHSARGQLELAHPQPAHVELLDAELLDHRAPDGEPADRDRAEGRRSQDFSQQSDPGYYPALYAALQGAYGPGVLDGNVNTLALDEMSDAAAHATLTFAMTSSDVSGSAQGGGSNKSGAGMEFKGSHLKK